MTLEITKIRKSGRIFYAVCAVLFIFFFIRSWQMGRNDFTAYYTAGIRAWQGESPYRLEETPFRYLPVTAFFFIPLTLLPVKAASLLFFTLNFSAVIAVYAQIRKRIGDFSTLFVALLFFRFHNHDFGNAQVNPILLALFFYWWKNRNRNLAFSTLAFTIFASFKLMPFAFALPLLLLGRWKELSWMGLWAVVLNFIPIFFYDQGPLVFRDWYQQARAIEFPAVMLSNVQSLPSALWWQLQGKIDPQTFATSSYLLQLLLLIALIALAPRKDEDRRENWIIASTLALTAIIAPMAWKHNYLQFLPLVFLWFREDPTFSEMRTRIQYGVMILGMVLIPSAVSAWNRAYSDRMYLMVWSGLLVILLGLFFARKSRNQMLPIEK